MCDVSAAVIAGTAVAGAAASASSKKKATTTTSTQVKDPWAPQAAHLENAFGQAQANMDAQAAKGPYQGSLSAGQNDLQRQGYQTGTNYATGAGATLATQAGAVSSNLMGTADQFASTAGALAGNGSGPLNGTSVGVLSGAANGQTAAMGQAGTVGLSGATGALGRASSLATQAGQDPNAALRSAAMGYVNSQDVDSQVNAATRDVARTLGEETLPGLNARAMGGGTVNSARAGAAEAVARRGAEDRAADISTSIRTNAYNTGLQTALAAQGQQNSLALGANAQAGALSQGLLNTGENARQFDTGSATSAASSLGQLDLSNRQLDANTRLGANAQLGQATQMGFAGATTAGALNDANANRFITAGGAQQAEEQRQLDSSYEQFMRPYTTNQGLLQNYMGVVGSQNWGGSSTGTETTPAQNPSILQGALGGAAAGVGIAQGFGGGSATTGVGSYGANSTSGIGALSVDQLQGVNLTQNPRVGSAFAGTGQAFNRYFG